MRTIQPARTPPESRVVEGAFGEAVLPARAQPAPVYVYDAAVRLWHWVTALCIFALVATGYLIGSPPPTLSGEASEHFLFGYIRLVHFAAGQVLGVMFLLRLYRALVGGPHARQIFYAPVWSLAWLKEVWFEIQWYLFLKPRAKDYVGHNPLAHLAMFFVFVLPLILMLLTGFALYAEGAGVDSLWYRAFGWVFAVFGWSSMTVHTVHHFGMWLIVLFSLIHMYMAIREDFTRRQTTVSAMVSGWRYFK
jgi:Ni/Fe-hydrogenase 1 B-type cytochrome subunit